MCTMRGEYETREIRNFAFLYKFRELVLIFILAENRGCGKKWQRASGRAPEQSRAEQNEQQEHCFP